MKIAIIDMIYPFGHKRLNSSLVEMLKSFSEIVLLDYQNFYENICTDEKLSKIQIKKLFFVPRLTILKRICDCINLIIIKKKLNGEEYDALLIMTYDNIGLSIMKFLFEHKPIYIVHHNNIDLIKSKIDFFFFKRYMNCVNHIVLSEFIKEGLISKTNVNRNRVYVLEHPLSKNITVDIRKEYIDMNSKNRVFVSLGLGSDEFLIHQLIEIDKQGEYFKNNGIKVILRSRIYDYESDGLKVFKGILPEDEYYRLYAISSAYLLLYPDMFQNRFSASLLNALQYGKCVISTNIPMASHFGSLYPSNCRIITDIKHLLDELINGEFKFSHEEYDDLLKRHEDNMIKEQARGIFG